jgi:hypothetical protein
MKNSGLQPKLWRRGRHEPSAEARVKLLLAARDRALAERRAD